MFFVQTKAGCFNKKIKKDLFSVCGSCQQKTAAAQTGQGLLGNRTGKTGSNCCVKGIAACLKDYCRCPAHSLMASGNNGFIIFCHLCIVQSLWCAAHTTMRVMLNYPFSILPLVPTQRVGTSKKMKIPMLFNYS